MLSSTLNRSKVGRCLPVLLATLIFVGCSTQKTPDPSAQYLQGTVTAGSAFYLQQMQQSADDSKINWQLLAIHALLNEGKTARAVELYSTLPPKLNDEQQQEQSLLLSEIKIAQKAYPSAVALLDKITPSSLNKSQQSRYYQAIIDANQRKPSLTLLRAYIAQEPLLKGQAHLQNIDATWQAISMLTPEQLSSLVINADENTLQGWLDLQHVWSNNRTMPDKLKAGIKEWQIRYPINPGATSLPTQLIYAQNIKPSSTAKIALLLPLNGQAAIFGRVIQKGFEAAQNKSITPVSVPEQTVSTVMENNTPQRDTQSDSTNTVVSPSSAPVNDLTHEVTASQSVSASVMPVPTPTYPAAEIKLYDTSTQPLPQILTQAQQDGATIIVGPLLKNNVEQLSRSPISLNALALNLPENVTNQPNICYFALSPEDEARDAAQHIWQQNHRNPLLLVPGNDLGKRITKAFTNEWEKLGGGQVLQQKFGSLSELKRNINRGVGIALTGTPVNQPVVTQPTPPQNGLATPGSLTNLTVTAGSGKVDAVYIIATPDEIALLKPMLAMRNNSQDIAQLYASSRSSQGGRGADFPLEMEGLQFSEIPLLSGGNSDLMNQVLSNVNNDYSLARLYAMGVDAWSLVNHYSQLRHTPDFKLNGNTGILSVTQDCVINRTLNWLQFSQGKVVPVT